jgi:hypothetical protein
MVLVLMIINLIQPYLKNGINKHSNQSSGKPMSRKPNGENLTTVFDFRIISLKSFFERIFCNLAGRKIMCKKGVAVCLKTMNRWAQRRREI